MNEHTCFKDPSSCKVCNEINTEYQERLYKGPIAPGIVLKFPDGHLLKYKETNIPHIFFSIKSALLEGEKYHPEVVFTPMRVYFNFKEIINPLTMR